jgi:hypothetical protein
LTHAFLIGRNSFENVSFHFTRHPFRFVAYEKCNETCKPARFIPQTIPKSNPAIVRLLTNQTAKAERIRLLRWEVVGLAERILDELAKNATVRHYSNHTQRLEAIRCVEAQKTRLNSPEGMKTNDPRVLTNFNREFKRCIGPIYRRIDENRTFWKEAERLYKAIQEGQYLTRKWRGREMPGDGPTIFRFEQKLNRMDLWFNETLKTMGRGFDATVGMPVRPKQVSDKVTEFNADLTAAKKVLGAANSPRLMRRDGSQPTGEEWDKLKDMDFLKSMSDLNHEDDMAGEDEEDNDL